MTTTIAASLASIFARNLPPRLIDVLLALPRIGDLILVPAVVRALTERWTLAGAWAVLDRLDVEGVIELRPDAGGLSPEDAALCPPGPVGGTVYATLRLCALRGAAGPTTV